MVVLYTPVQHADELAAWGCTLSLRQMSTCGMLGGGGGAAGGGGGKNVALRSSWRFADEDDEHATNSSTLAVTVEDEATSPCASRS